MNWLEIAKWILVYLIANVLLVAFLMGASEQNER